MKLYRSLMGKYADGENVNDVYHVYGMAVAYETVGSPEASGCESDPCRADGAGPLDHECGEPVPAPRDIREDRQGRQLPDSAGAAPALDERPLGAVRRALAVEAELGAFPAPPVVSVLVPAGYCGL